MPRTPIKISQARSRLPELARYLARHPDQVVLVEHRDLDDRMVLMTEGRLRYLETLIEELRKQVGRPFRLAGSITSGLGDEELELALKKGQAEQGRLEDEKLRVLAS
jgi:hypothetical protein